MRHGPWGNYTELRYAKLEHRLPRAFDGKRPVAIELDKGERARWLYEVAEGREPMPTRFEPNPQGPDDVPLPVYPYLEDED